MFIILTSPMTGNPVWVHRRYFYRKFNMSELLLEEKPTGIFDYLEVFILDDDQPTTCPRCAVRTKNSTCDSTLICTCPSCHFTFRGEFPNDG